MEFIELTPKERELVNLLDTNKLLKMMPIGVTLGRREDGWEVRNSQGRVVQSHEGYIDRKKTARDALLALGRQLMLYEKAKDLGGVQYI